MHVTDAAPQAERSRAEYALAYAARGWAVVPLYWTNDDGSCGCSNPHDGANGNLSPNSRGKHPHSLLAPHGSLSASKDPDTLQRWFAGEPRLNVGIATGEVSGIVAVDIDPRDGGNVTWSDFIGRNGGQVPDTTIASTGGGGQHVVFRYVADQVIRTPGKGIQIKGNGGYIVVEPSRHHSGSVYAWHAECDPLEGADPAPAPEWLVAPRSADMLVVRGDQLRVAGYLPPQRIADLKSALACLDPDPYETWFQIGMALHSTDAPEAFDLWDTWSQRSPKYDLNVLRRKWASFGREGLHVESIFAWALAAGWTGETERVPVPIESVMPHAPAPARSAADLGLLELPGALGEVVRLANLTAPRPQPPFAVSAALALGSAVAGRRFRALPRNNWSSLYFINVGQSASGKEHARTVIDAVLTAAEWPQLIGRNGYASDSAVLSALLHQPAHIAIVDEIGALLGNAQSEGAMHARAAITALVEAWGNLHGTMRPKAYSTTALTKEQADAILSRIVYNPALSLLGMTTPRTFFGALTDGSIEGGFLARLIVVDTEIGRQPMAEAHALVVPQSVIDWCTACRHHSAGRGNLGTLDVSAENRPVPTDVPTDPGAQRAFSAYEREVLSAMDTLEDEGLAELEGRSVEKSMRIALILAVSVSPSAPKITADLADWAITYVRHWTDRTLRAVREHMHGSRFGQWQAEVLRVIRRGAEKGRTERDLAHYSRTYDGLDLRQRRAVLDALQAKGAIALVESAPSSGRGRKRLAWLAIEANDDE